MPSVTSKVEICNLALSHLDAGIISNIDSPTTEAERECAKWYDTTRRALLRKYNWNFARKRRSIARAGTPEFGMSDYYVLPSDWVRLVGFGVDGDSESDYKFYQRRYTYEIEGRNLLVDASGATSLNIIYIWNHENVYEFDALFVELLALKLAMVMAYKFTTKKGVLEMVKVKLEAAEADATAIDGQERPPVIVQSSRFLSARKRGAQSYASTYVDLGG